MGGLKERIITRNNLTAVQIVTREYPDSEVMLADLKKICENHDIKPDSQDLGNALKELSNFPQYWSDSIFEYLCNLLPPNQPNSEGIDFALEKASDDKNWKRVLIIVKGKVKPSLQSLNYALMQRAGAKCYADNSGFGVIKFDGALMDFIKEFYEKDPNIDLSKVLKAVSENNENLILTINYLVSIEKNPPDADAVSYAMNQAAKNGAWNTVLLLTEAKNKPNLNTLDAALQKRMGTPKYSSIIRCPKQFDKELKNFANKLYEINPDLNLRNAIEAIPEKDADLPETLKYLFSIKGKNQLDKNDVNGMIKKAAAGDNYESVKVLYQITGENKADSSALNEALLITHSSEIITLLCEKNPDEGQDKNHPDSETVSNLLLNIIKKTPINWDLLKHLSDMQGFNKPDQKSWSSAYSYAEQQSNIELMNFLSPLISHPKMVNSENQSFPIQNFKEKESHSQQATQINKGSNEGLKQEKQLKQNEMRI